MTANKRLAAAMLLLISGFGLLSLVCTDSLPIVFAAASEDQSSYLPLLSKPQLTPTPTETPPPSGWLAYLNYLRSLGELASVTENTTWSEGCWLHSRYMVKNDEIGHKEDPGNPWYTTEGHTAASNSNVMVSSSTSSPDEFALDLWMAGPFHGISMIDPQLESVGFGSYREALGTWQMGAALDVLRGRTSTEPPGGTYPVTWPGDGQTTPVLSFGGAEWPDPLTSCPDYTVPSGPPIYLQIGSGGLTPNVTATSFQQGSSNLSHCVFDETNYSNPDSTEQSLGRQLLDSRDAIILIPQQPLIAGQTYSVSISANGSTYTWSFNAGNSTQTPFSIKNVEHPPTNQWTFDDE